MLSDELATRASRAESLLAQTARGDERAVQHAWRWSRRSGAPTASAPSSRHAASPLCSRALTPGARGVRRGQRATREQAERAREIATPLVRRPRPVCVTTIRMHGLTLLLASLWRDSRARKGSLSWRARARRIRGMCAECDAARLHYAWAYRVGAIGCSGANMSLAQSVSTLATELAVMTTTPPVAPTHGPSK